VFHSVNELITAIEDYLKATNDNPKSFVWTATAKQMLAKVIRGRVALQQAKNQEWGTTLNYTGAPKGWRASPASLKRRKTGN
jgi:hypothetical protein